MKKKTQSQVRHTRQLRLSSEQNAYRILGTVLRFQDCEVSDSRVNKEFEIKWTIETLSNQLGIEYNVAQCSIVWLVMKGYLEHRIGQYYRTVAGELAYNEATQSIQFDNGKEAFEFKNEVLTGMDSRGDQTTIEGAVLNRTPKAGHGNYEEDAQIEIAQSVARFRRIASEVGLSIEDTLQKVSDGSIKRCNKCQQWKDHYRHNGKNGQRFQSICKDCMRDGRK